MRVARAPVAGVLAVLAAFLPATPSPAAVDVDDDLMLGVWSPQRGRFVAAVPACVSRDPDEPAGAYRITAAGGATDGGFAMVNDVGDEIPYRVRWFAEGDSGRRETLRAGTPSKRTYAYRTSADCAAGDVSGLEARARERDVDRAPPGVYRDVLVLTVSPL